MGPYAIYDTNRRWHRVPQIMLDGATMNDRTRTDQIVSSIYPCSAGITHG